MSTVLTEELEQFQRFVAERHGASTDRMSLEECLVDFRGYQDELARFNEGLQESIDQAGRGEAQPLDVDAMMSEIDTETQQSPAGFHGG